ncbi:hypothetical protein EMCRGX_G034412 [Ephydatia muelleri]
MPPKQVVKTGGKKVSNSAAKPPAAAKQVAPRKPQSCTPAKTRGGAALTVGGKGVASKVTAPKAKGVKTKSPTAKDEKKDVGKKVWTKEDDMAKRIQIFYRHYRSKKLKLELRKKEEEYNNLMEKLQREAYLEMVKLEQERAEKERQREEERRRREREEAKRVKRMLEAAFDGEDKEIGAVLDEVLRLHDPSSPIALLARARHRMVECRDPHGNTPLSEAGAGGHWSTIGLLLELGADPNSRGQYGRTPLYRAAFGGYLEAVKVFLQNGADPRIVADDGATPMQVSANAEVEQTLKQWDVSTTEQLLVVVEQKRLKRLEEENHLRTQEEGEIQILIDEAEREHSAKQNQLRKAYEELNKRIFEHDEAIGVKPEVTLQAIHDAEDFLEQSKISADKAKQKLQEIKMKLRMKRSEYCQEQEEREEEIADKCDVMINIKELDDVLMKDVGGKIKASGKWPLIVDPGKRAQLFLRYRDTNYLTACDPVHMTSETVRMAILGALRYGKFVVIDLLDIEDMWTVITQKFDDVYPGLLLDIMKKDILNEDRYTKLMRPGDSEDYSPKKFITSHLEGFGFVVISQLFTPPPDVAQFCYVIRIHTPVA